MAAHALLSPSGASRWLACPPSVRLEQSVPDRAGAAAAEGTLAHKLAEEMLRFKLGEIRKTAWQKELKAIQADPLYTPEMLVYMEDYTNYVMVQYDEAKKKTSDALIFLETRLDLSAYAPDCFGTGDVCIVADHIMDFTDLKYGKGVPVSAVENKQMMLYALGLYEAYGHLYDVHTMRMTIYQPRLDNISVWEISVAELLQWAEDELKPKAKLAFEGKGEFKAGKHCQFCRVKETCRANHDYHMELIKHDFANPELLTDEEVVEVIGKADELAKWAKGVKDFALMQAIRAGKAWPGMKLVEGRSVRKYLDENQILIELEKEGYKREDLMKPAVIVGITELTKVIGKAKFTKIVEPLTVKPQGSPTLAPETDPRPVFQADKNVLDEFSDDFNDD